MREPINQLIEPVHEATFTVRGTMIEISVTSKDLNERGNDQGHCHEIRQSHTERLTSKLERSRPE